MPRQTTVRISMRRKDHRGYQVSHGEGWVLHRIGWKVSHRGRSYIYVEPPEVGSVGKTVDVTLSIPTDSEIIEAATGLRRSAQPGQQNFGMFHEWPFLYLPEIPSEVLERQSIQAGDWTPQTLHYGRWEHCTMGFGGLWRAEVTWRSDGTPVLATYPTAEVSAERQLPLFDDPPIPIGTGFDPNEVPAGTYVEGAVAQILVNAYERDRHARDACIACYGPICRVCGLDFEKVYGRIGRGFIHVHHLKPLSQIGGEYEVDPIEDLCPVCPNCHAMLHQETPPLSIERLKALLRISTARTAT